MTIDVEIYIDCTSPLDSSRRLLADRKKISVQGIYSQTVQVRGKYDHAEVSTIVLEFRCPHCSYYKCSVCEAKNYLIWEEETQEFSDSVTLAVSIEEGECENCELEKLNKCLLPCYNPRCQQHPEALYEFDPYDGWTPTS